MDVNVAGFTPLPPGNEKRINGTRVSAVPGSGHEDVIDYSDEGISLTSPDQFSIGMNWDDVAIGMSSNDGLRTLIGSDGMGIRVVPAKWRNVAPLIKQITASVPSERWVHMDDPDALAAPPAKSAPKPAWMRLASLRRYLLAMLIITDVLAGIFTVFGLVGVTGGATDTGSVALFVFFTTIFVLSMGATVGVVVQSRWYRAVSIIVGLLMFFTVVGAVIGIPMMIVAARLPVRAASSSST